MRISSRVLARGRKGKQGWLLRWRVSDGFKLRIAMPKRLRHSHFVAGEHVNQLQRVHHALALKMIVRDDERGLRFFSNMANSPGPRFQLLLGVEIVVALVAGNLGIVAEPRILAAAMPANLTQPRWSAGP